MRATKLILLEGLPGSGKSTAAQFLTRQLAHRQIPVTWWYEEVRDHPLYPFDDAASLRRVVDDLFTGNHHAVIATVLAKWQAFAGALASSDGIVVLDGCLFGYLTWSLFPADVPEAEIAAYVMQVAAIIASLNPSLIYLHQDDVARALRTICDRRGGDTEQAFIRRATGNPYAVRRGLAGVDGLVRYWTDYRALLDPLFARLPFPKLAIENSVRDWPAYQARMLAFLGLPPDLVPPARPGEPGLTGTYHAIEDGAPLRCRVSLDGDSLTIDGLPHVGRTPGSCRRPRQHSRSSRSHSRSASTSPDPAAPPACRSPDRRCSPARWTPSWSEALCPHDHVSRMNGRAIVRPARRRVRAVTPSPV